MNMKKISSLLLALVLVLAMAVPAMAATVSNPTGHSYAAYQIFAGSQKTAEGPLGDVTWGTDINDSAFLTALKADTRFVEEGINIFAECKDAADVADVLSEYQTNSDVAKAFANVAAANLKGTGTPIAANAPSVELATGYYLLVDTQTVNGQNDAKNSALLEVVNDITIEKKYTLPTVDKTITGEGDAADFDIGDDVPFTLTGTLPENYADYETYKYVFHDKLSTGMNFNENSVLVKVDGTTITTGYEVVTEDLEDGCTFEVRFANLKTITAVTAASEITVEYTAKLNASAEIGMPGNPNEVYLEYSNNPNQTGDGTPDTGKTTPDTVVVFTYQLDVTKVDGKDATKLLADAEFVLYREVKVEGSETSVEEYVIVDANGKVTGWTATKPATGNLKSDANGEFIISGLDAGTYYLEETKAPAGYNLLTAPITIVITAEITDTEEVQTLDTLTIDVTANGTTTNGTGDVDTGVVNATVENNIGSTLPETGGMGTTILYVAGGILVLGAVIVLITKKRMAASK